MPAHSRNSCPDHQEGSLQVPLWGCTLSGFLKDRRSASLWNSQIPAPHIHLSGGLGTWSVPAAPIPAPGSTDSILIRLARQPLDLTFQAPAIPAAPEAAPPGVPEVPADALRSGGYECCAPVSNTEPTGT